MKAIIPTRINLVLTLNVIILILLVGAQAPSFATHVGAQKTQTAQRQQGVQKSTVRGKIERKGKTGTYPAAYVRVRLVQSNAKDNVNSVYTGSDGMYYFRNVPPGTYVLEIWGQQESVIMSFSIKVSNRPYTDLAPITVP